MEEFARRVENWFVEVIWIVLDISAVKSVMVVRIFDQCEGSSHGWDSCGEECFLRRASISDRRECLQKWGGALQYHVLEYGYFTNSFLCLYHLCSTTMEMANTSQTNKEQNRIDEMLGVDRYWLLQIMRLLRLLRLKPAFIRQQLPRKTLLPRAILIHRVST